MLVAAGFHFPDIRLPNELIAALLKVDPSAGHLRYDALRSFTVGAENRHDHIFKGGDFTSLCYLFARNRVNAL